MHYFNSQTLLNIEYINVIRNLKYKTGIPQCYENLPLNYSHFENFSHYQYMNYSRCILDHGPQMSFDEKTSGILLVVDSLCPLGIEITQQLRDNKIEHIDIRGIQHLNISSDAGKSILNQFHISKALIVCETLMSRNFNSKLTVVSAVKNIHGDVNIDLPPVFGHMRCKHSDNKYEDLFFKCIKKNLNKTSEIVFSNSKLKFVLANDAAKFVLDIIKSNYNNGDFKLSSNIKTYSIEELYHRFYSYCVQNLNDELIESLMYSCHHFPPQDNKSLTLSIVSTLSSNVDYLKRAMINFDIFDYFLQLYPYLPFELVLVTVGFNFSKYLVFGNNLKKHVRLICVSEDDYQSMIAKLNINYFPEFIMRNAGIRRSKGEFILCFSTDAVLTSDLYDYILHRQFNLNSYVRSIRKVSSGSKLDLLNNLFYSENHFEQYLVDYISRQEIHEILKTQSCGDFQLTHWKIWEKIHGYIEGQEVFHVDAALSLDIAALVPCPLFVKIIGFDFHIDHIKISKLTKRFLYWKFLKMERKGFISAYSYKIRNDWGLSHLTNLPKVYF